MVLQLWRPDWIGPALRTSLSSVHTDTHTHTMWCMHICTQQGHGMCGTHRHTHVHTCTRAHVHAHTHVHARARTFMTPPHTLQSQCILAVANVCVVSLKSPLCTKRLHVLSLRDLPHQSHLCYSQHQWMLVVYVGNKISPPVHVWTNADVSTHLVEGITVRVCVVKASWAVIGRDAVLFVRLS